MTRQCGESRRNQPAPNSRTAETRISAQNQIENEKAGEFSADNDDSHRLGSVSFAVRGENGDAKGEEGREEEEDDDDEGR